MLKYVIYNENAGEFISGWTVERYTTSANRPEMFDSEQEAKANAPHGRGFRIVPVTIHLEPQTEELIKTLNAAAERHAQAMLAIEKQLRGISEDLAKLGVDTQ